MNRIIARTRWTRETLRKIKTRLRILKPLWRGYRGFCARLPWRWVPVSSQFLGPPKGWHRSTADYLRSGHADAADRTIVVEPAQVLQRSLPRAVDPAMLAHFRPALQQEVRAREVHVLHGGRFWGDYAGTFVGKDDHLLGDLTRDIWEVSHHRIFAQLKLPACRRLAGTSAILVTAEADHNYWHWTFEVLARLELMQRAGFVLGDIDHFVVNHRDLAFQRETLADLGVPWSKVVRADARLHVACERALITRSDEHMYAVTPSTCAFLRASAGATADVRGGRRLYVTRARAAFRRVVNEDAVWQILRQRGFERIDPGALTVEQQRAAFRAADVVVGPHGAGLANIVYCRPATRLLELFAPRFVDLSYWCFSGWLGIEHWVLVDPAAPVVEQKPNPLGLEDDMVVDERLLEATLNAMRL